MPITVADLEAELISDLGPMMQIVGLNATLTNGSNPSLAGPIRKAIVASGGTISNPPAVSDADIQTATGSFETLALHGRLALLEKIWGNWPHVDMKSGEETQMLSQLAKRIQDWLASLKEELKDPDSVVNNPPPGPPVAGIIEVGSTLNWPRCW